MTFAHKLLGKGSKLRWIALGIVVGMSVGGLGKAPAGPTTGAVFKVGAAKVSIAPSPPAGNTWQTTGCFEENENVDVDHALPTRGHGWPATQPECIYLGGFGIGPARAAYGVHPTGVYVRAIAISNGTKTFVYAIIDAVGYFSRYQDAIVNGLPAGVCSDCGLLDIRNKIVADETARGLSIAADDIVLANTHTHSGPDGYGGWGGLPSWYWEQLRDAFVDAGEQAIANLTEANIDVGSTVIRNRNNERRDTYYSTPDYQAVWLQATALDGSVIATLANYAGHPTILGDSNHLMHADWPGATARHFEELYGGTGLLFEGGLGNVSVNSTGESDPYVRVENTGISIADTIAADIGRNPNRLQSSDMRNSVDHITHPVLTNQGLAVLGSLGLFSREFIPGTPGADGPSAYKWSKSGMTSAGYLRGCETASDISIKTFAGAFKIGEFGIVYGPGEIFSNITEVAKSKLNKNVALATFAQGNDALGYIMQSFEYDYPGAGAAGEYATGHGEYEEVFAIDHCFGDHVLQSILDAGQAAGLR